MKQVFNEIREKLNEIKVGMTYDADVIWNAAIVECILKIYEAEVKWNEDVCEWKPFGIDDLWDISCDEVYARPADGGVEWFNYCPKCGKKIKVVK